MIIQIREVLLAFAKAWAFGLCPANANPGLRDLFFLSVYDALFLIRPWVNFRDGRVIKNYTANLREYFIQLPFNDGYFFGLIHLIPGDYSRLELRCRIMLTFSALFWALTESRGLDRQRIILGFAPVFLFIKSYGAMSTDPTQSLMCEVSQLCYKGVLRRIALGTTDGMCTWRCGGILLFQGLIVPVGRIALGRIFNVVGSIIDAFLDL